MAQWLTQIKVFFLTAMLVAVLAGCSDDSDRENTDRGTQGNTGKPGSISANTTPGPGETVELTDFDYTPSTTGETTGTTAQTTEETSTGQDESKNPGKPREKVDKKTGLLLSDTLVAGAVDRTGGPLVKNRMVSYYGHPFSAQMGVLGQYEPNEMVRLLKEQAKAYTELDPDRPSIPTIELIASVAQPEPGPDGLYLNRTPTDVIEEYAQLAKENDLLLLLDIQIGYSTIAEEIEVLMPFLEREYVHLAIDPEYDMEPGEIPGQQFGNSSGEEIMDAARTLSDLVKKKDLPAKVLVIHQFRYDMITNKEKIEPVPNVEMVLHADGFGTPEQKIKKYDLLVTKQPIQYGGFKLFYNQDVPLMAPEQVLKLNPPPAVVSYQ